MRLAYFSAPMRQGLFAQVVLPALRKLAYHHNIELVAFGCAPHSLDDASSPLRVRTPAWEPDYTKALAALQSWNPEIILQPDIETLSTPYKLPHMLLTAASVGAALVASRISPYTELANQAHQSVVLAANSGASWQESIRLLLDSEGLRHRLATNAIAYVRESFKTEANLNVIAHIAEQHRAPDLTARSHRAIALEPCLSAAKNTAAAIANNHRHTMRQQELATAQYQRDIADIEASLADSRRILALHAVTAR